MIEKFESLQEDKGEFSFKEISKDKATHKHLCYHDEATYKSCRRVKL